VPTRLPGAPDSQDSRSRATTQTDARAGRRQSGRTGEAFDVADPADDQDDVAVAEDAACGRVAEATVIDVGLQLDRDDGDVVARAQSRLPQRDTTTPQGNDMVRAGTLAGSAPPSW
jgi:hypothetical protein